MNPRGMNKCSKLISWYNYSIRNLYFFGVYTLVPRLEIDPPSRVAIFDLFRKQEPGRGTTAPLAVARHSALLKMPSRSTIIVHDLTHLTLSCMEKHHGMPSYITYRRQNYRLGIDPCILQFLVALDTGTPLVDSK
jgi:hypothetical protein